jgi:hypothetical protein
MSLASARAEKLPAASFFDIYHPIPPPFSMPRTRKRHLRHGGDDHPLLRGAGPIEQEIMTMHRNDSGSDRLVRQIALATIGLSNPKAWREIEALLLNAGLSQRQAHKTREAVWRERRRTRTTECRAKTPSALCSDTGPTLYFAQHIAGRCTRDAVLKPVRPYIRATGG